LSASLAAFCTDAAERARDTAQELEELADKLGHELCDTVGTGFNPTRLFQLGMVVGVLKHIEADLWVIVGEQEDRGGP
jgi:hypothetical protein